MQRVAAKVEINADRTVTVQLPDGIPAGKYDAVLVLVDEVNAQEDSESQPWDAKLAAAWEKWVEEVEQLPLSPQPAKSKYHKSLIEKYRKQGLDL